MIKKLKMENPVVGVEFMRDKEGKVKKIMAGYLTGAKQVYSIKDANIPKDILKLVKLNLKKEVKKFYP